MIIVLKYYPSTCTHEYEDKIKTKQEQLIYINIVTQCINLNILKCIIIDILFIITNT